MASVTMRKVARPQVGTAIRLFYGSGQAVDSVVQAAINVFLLFYLTTVRGMPGSAAGLVFFLSLAVDAVLDPAIGRWSDRWRGRWGRRLPFMAGALPLVAISLVAIFAAPAGLSGAALFGYVLAFNVLLRVALSIYALPYSALTAELTDDYVERSAIGGWRALFIVAGTAACVGPAMAIFARSGGLAAPHGYPPLGWWAAALVLGFGGLCLAGSGRAVLRLRAPAEPAGAPVAFVRDLRQLFANPSFPPLFAGAVLALVGQGAANALNLHAFRYFWGLPEARLQWPVLVMPLGMLVGIPAAALLLRRLEKRDGVIAAIAVMALLQGLLPLAALAGLLPRGGPAALAALLVNATVFAGCGIVCFVCFFSMIADAVDDHDLLFGVRREALYAAALMLGAKAATGLGGLLAGAGLQWVGASGGGPPAEGAARGVALLWGPGAALLMLAAVPALLRYRIDRAHHASVIARLARGTASQEPLAA